MFFSKIILKIISFLNRLIFIIFLRVINVSSMFDLHIKTIIFIAFIFCIRFISCFFFNSCHQFHFFIWFLFRRNVDLAQKKCWDRDRRLFNRYFCSNVFFNRVFRFLDHSFQLFDHFFQFHYLFFETFIYCFRHARAFVSRCVFHHVEKFYHYYLWYNFRQILFFWFIKFFYLAHFHV